MISAEGIHADDDTSSAGRSIRLRPSIRSVLPVWRSLLYVPVISQRFVASAARSEADAVILDLEDSIAIAQKTAARDALPGAIDALATCGADILVRINSPWRWLVKDIEAAVERRVRAIVLPKARSDEHVRMVAEVIAELEHERGLPIGTIGLVPLIETVDALSQAQAIASADPRVIAISLGDEDFSTAAGCDCTEDTLHLPKQMVSLAARQAGILSLGYLGTLADYRELSAFPALLRRSRAFGYSGAPCIHPSQIAHLNTAFQPSAEEVLHARRVLASADAAHAAGLAVAEIDGRMIDRPAFTRALCVLEQAEQIAAKEQLRCVRDA